MWKAHRPCEHQVFQVSPLAHHVFDRVALRDAADVLLDDGALGQVRSHVVGCGTDDPHSSLLGR
jgi:hypothetical protein